MLPYRLLPTPQIIERLHDSIEAEAAKTISPSEARRLPLQLERVAEDVLTGGYTTQSEDSLKQTYNQLKESDSKSILAPVSFLLSQLYVARETPPDALSWNDRAQRQLQHSSALLSASVLSQRASILMQENRLPDAVELEKSHNPKTLSKGERILVSQPWVQLHVALEYEAGQPAKNLKKRFSSMGMAGIHFYRGRFYLQAAQSDAAYLEFERALKLIQDDTVGSLVINLHLAKALLHSYEMIQAERLFKSVAEQTKGRMQSTYLAARIGTAEVYRMQGRLSRAETVSQAVVESAQKLKLGKTMYSALVCKAMALGGRNELDQANIVLDRAEKHLNELNKKERCTLFRRRSELGYRRNNGSASDSFAREAINLVVPDRKDELALLRATMELPKAWNLIRGNSLQEATSLIDENLKNIDGHIFRNRKSPYRTETATLRTQYRLLRAKAYCALKLGKYAQCITDCRTAHRVFSDKAKGERTRKTRFLEGIAYALAGRLDSALSLLVPDPKKHQGNLEAEILTLLREYEYLDNRDSTRVLAIQVLDQFYSSPSYDRFKIIAGAFALVSYNQPFGKLAQQAMLKPAGESSDQEWQFFLATYERTYATQYEDDEILASFSSRFPESDTLEQSTTELTRELRALTKLPELWELIRED